MNTRFSFSISEFMFKYRPTESLQKYSSMWEIMAFEHISSRFEHNFLRSLFGGFTLRFCRNGARPPPDSDFLHKTQLHVKHRNDHALTEPQCAYLPLRLPYSRMSVPLQLQINLHLYCSLQPDHCASTIPRMVL